MLFLYKFIIRKMAKSFRVAIFSFNLPKESEHILINNTMDKLSMFIIIVYMNFIEVNFKTNCMKIRRIVWYSAFIPAVIRRV